MPRTTELRERAYGENQLTDKERSFCTHYVSHYNIAKAAREAGYSGKTAKQMGQKLIKKSNVVSYIGKLQSQALEDVELSLPSIMQELAYAVKRNLDDFTDDEGFLIVDPRKMSTRAKACVDGIKAKQYLDQDGNISSQEIEFKLVPKFPAIQLALRRLEDVKEYQKSIDWDSMYEADNEDEDSDSIEQTISQELLVRKEDIKKVESKTL